MYTRPLSNYFFITFCYHQALEHVTTLWSIKTKFALTRVTPVPSTLIRRWRASSRVHSVLLTSVHSVRSVRGRSSRSKLKEVSRTGQGPKEDTKTSFLRHSNSRLSKSSTLELFLSTTKKCTRDFNRCKAIADCKGPFRYSKSSHQLHEPPRRKVLRAATLYTPFLVAARDLAACSLLSVFWPRDSDDKLQVYH